MHFFSDILAWLKSSHRPNPRPPPLHAPNLPGGKLEVGAAVKVLILVEGTNDVRFLRHISGMLHAHRSSVPDLNVLERRGEILFVPVGGGDLLPWTYRLAALGRGEFFLLDREDPPVTAVRQQIAAIVNLRPGCRAFVTRKRSLENYLHPLAILEARGVEVTFQDDDSVAERVAQQMHAESNSALAWQKLSTRQRRRKRDRAKKWLNSEAVERMTAARLSETDPEGEIRQWLTTIAAMVAAHS